jgi:galactose mutarotase-like enzyme
VLYTLENEYIKISADTVGAELTDITSKKTGTEFLWNANPKHWGNHAPILFPFIGRLNNGSYKLNGMEYKMDKHGFARNSEFTTEEETENSLEFALSADNMENYPFAFELKVKYTLEFNEIMVDYSVKNKGETDMYFSIGGHPAFKCPIDENEKFEDYYLEFNKKESVDTIGVNAEGYLTEKNIPLLNNENKIDLNYPLFEGDALILKGLRSDEISLKSKNHKKRVDFEFGNFPILGVWTKADAPFVCLEPWFGSGDFENFNGEVSEKAGIIELKPKRVFVCGYVIKILDI